MPGIVGLITRLQKGDAEAQLSRMVEALCHESFYMTGTLSNEHLGLYVGWVTRKGSFADGMPLYSSQRDMALVFAGEEFSDPDTGLQNEAGSLSYLVRMAQHAGFPRSLNGQFHGLAANFTEGRITLFNDRYGIHRLYYHEANGAFYFAAEAKAILAVRPELKAIDPRGLAEFISCGCTLENRSIFKNIHVLPPASEWTFRNSHLESRRSYFDPKEWEEQPILDEESYYRQLRDVFSQRLNSYFATNEKVGVSLTGGLDSRMIMSWHKAEPGTVPCYSFGGPYRDCQDVVIARKVAEICKQPHEVIPVGSEFLAKFPHYAERTVFLTDGCVEVKHSPDLHANRIAAEIAPVRMTGNYGGEVLRRIRAFKPFDPIPDLYHPDLLPRLHHVKDTYASLLLGHPLSFAVFRQAPWHHTGLLSLERSQISLRSPYLDNEFVRTVFRAPQSSLISNDISLRLIQDGCPRLRRLRTDRGVGGSLSPIPTALRRNYLEFTFKAEYAYDYGMPQSLARVDHALSRFRLERLFLGRHKFYHFRIWYRDALRHYVREMLLDSLSLSRTYLQRNTVERIVDEHLKGTGNYTTSIHKLLTLEHLHRLFLDSR